jgi:hypothetical protein
MQTRNSILGFLGRLSWCPLIAAAVWLNPVSVLAAERSPQALPVSPSPQLDSSLQRLTQMFSPALQSVMNACWEQGRVNLAAGAAQNGALRCGDGSVATGVTYTNYVETMSDLLTASSLVGFRTVATSNPNVSPQLLTTYLSSAQGMSILQDAVQTAIVQSGLLPAQATDSQTFLTNQVIDRLLPNLQDPGRLENLLGNTEQYTSVVENFCTAPGMSIEQAKALVPELNSVQFYAICIAESGTMEEVLRLLR